MRGVGECFLVKFRKGGECALVELCKESVFLSNSA